MAGYIPPIDDISFLLGEVFDFDSQMAALPGFEEVNTELATSVLEEGGKFCAEILEPLNRPGDEEGCKLEGGIMEFIRMAKGRIGLVHVIDCDGTLNETGTSTHAPFGEGFINFDEVIPALLHEADYKGEWWAIDLCEWPDAWAVTAQCKAFVDKFNKKFCG